MNPRNPLLWICIAAIIFIFVPDPLDVVTAGIPIIEIAVAAYTAYKGALR